MKSLMILHIGDMHIDYDQRYKAKIQPSLDQIINYCKEVKVNAVVIPGDLTHRKQSYSNSSGVPMLLDFLKQLSRLVDFIFITKGNHDEPGSIALLHQLEPNIYAYEYPVCLGIANDDGIISDKIVDLLRSEEGDLPEADLIVSLIPYPTKSMFLSDDSINNNNANFAEKFEQIFELIGDITQPYTCPKILGFHGNVVGSRLSTGQTLQSQDIMVAPSTLEKAKADYYALNHIHLRQEIKPNMIYAGGIANFNWGETEPKSFESIEFRNWIESFGELEGRIIKDQIPFTSARPMMTVEAFYDNDLNDFHFTSINPETDPFKDPVKNYEVRFRCKVKENERNLITEEKIQKLKDHFGEDVKIEFNIVPTERESRSEKIMNCKTLIDEVIEYGTVIGEYPGSFKYQEIVQKVGEIQEEVQL
ncbi:MAG: metallophosphoesterase [Ignavibacteriales bacterium]|nr:metallophosphoesterase [Ignavibacteriales bacterium]